MNGLALKHGWLDVSLCLIAIVGMLGIWDLRRRQTPPKGIGVRVIQVLSMVILPPMVAILALEGVLSSEATGTIIGTVAGFALGGIANGVPKSE